MPRRVEYADDFSRDLRAEVDYLRRRREWSWIATLQEDLAELAEMLTVFPASGRELAREGSETLRKLRLRRAPLYAWYTVDPTVPHGPIRFMRLFHVRQKTPAPRM